MAKPCATPACLKGVHPGLRAQCPRNPSIGTSTCISRVLTAPLKTAVGRYPYRPTFMGFPDINGTTPVADKDLLPVT
jgi:hypothetical protein